MPILHIPEYLEANIEAAAARQGRTPQELIEQVLTDHVESEFPSPETFTEAQIGRFQQSIAQLDRGERIPAEQIDEFFSDWLHETDAR